MAATRKDIQRWFKEGKKQNATHMIVACDTFDWEDYPVFVMPGQDVRKMASKQEKVMEVYSLSKNMESQLDEPRAFHYD